MLSRQFPILILLGRAAAGKSEIINYLKSLPCDMRRAELHIGAFREIDDFPMLWAWFEEDRMLVQMGKPRLHTDEQGYFRFRYLWNLLIRRLELEYQKVLRDDPGFEKDNTVIIEFSRGAEHGGFGEALNQFSAVLLGRAAVLYVDVSYEESLRKNRKRFNPQKPDPFPLPLRGRPVVPKSSQGTTKGTKDTKKEPMSSTSSSRQREALTSEPLACPDCGELRLTRVTEACRLEDGLIVKRLRHHKCGACGARFFDDEAIHRIQMEREESRVAQPLP